MVVIIPESQGLISELRSTGAVAHQGETPPEFLWKLHLNLCILSVSGGMFLRKNFYNVS